MSRLLFLAAAAVLLPCASYARFSSRLDESWKNYANRKQGYCVSYPARWVRGEAADGAGMWFESGVKKFSIPQGEIDVIAIEEPGIQAVDYLTSHFEGLRKFERAEDVEIFANRQIQLPGVAGIWAKARYFDPQDRAAWIDEVVLAKRDGVLYRLELECHASQVERFERVFTRFVSSFRLDCNSK